MQTATRLPHGNLRGKGQVHAELVGKRTKNPFRDHQLVGGILHARGQKLDLVLLERLPVTREITPVSYTHLFGTFPR